MATPRVLIHVSGGVAHVVSADNIIDVYIIDWDAEDPIPASEIDYIFHPQPAMNQLTPADFDAHLAKNREEFEQAFLPRAEESA